MIGSSLPAPIVAHQGGWDELMWFAIPVVLVLVAVRWAEKKAAARREEPSNDDADLPGT